MKSCPGAIKGATIYIYIYIKWWYPAMLQSAWCTIQIGIRSSKPIVSVGPRIQNPRRTYQINGKSQWYL